MFALDTVHKVYDSRHGAVTALDSISLSIEPGSFVTITGRSGSGKTTLLLTLGGLVHPTSGAVKFKQQSLYDMSRPVLADYRNRKVGFVLQTFNLIPYLTAMENVMLPMMLNRDCNGSSSKYAAELLSHVGLADRMEHLPREMSVGQQQRVAIARALANNPEVILADEPTGNLDPGLAMEIIQILQDLNRVEGRTIIMVTHSPEAARSGGRQLRLEEGKLLN